MHRGTRNGRAYCPPSPVRRNGYTASNPAKQTAWDDCLPVPKLRMRTCGLIVFLAALTCFINSYDGAFVFDDSEAIVNNKDLKPDASLRDIFRHDFWGGDMSSNTSHKSYRPLTVLTFRLNYDFAGGLQPMGFHVVNIILHAMVSVLFLLVFSVFLTGRMLDEDDHLTFDAPRASLFAALLFAIHPVHTECVAGVVGRADLMCGLTFLLSFLCYVRSCHTDCGTPVRPTAFSPFWLFIAMGLCAVSVLFKEQGLTVLGICSAYDILIQCRVDLLQVAGLRKPGPTGSPSHSPKHRLQHYEDDHECGRCWVKFLIVRHVFLFFTGVFVLVGRWRIMGSSPPTFQEVDNPQSFLDSIIFRIINYNYIYSLNAWILLNPVWLCFDWSMGCVPVINSFGDPRILAAILFWLGLGGLLYMWLAYPQCKERRILGVSLAFLIVPFLPATNLFFRVGFVIAERILYLPSAGMCMAITLGIQQLCTHHSKLRNSLRWLLPVLLVLFAGRAIQRSHEWRTEVSLFESGEEVCPLNAKVQYNIAKVHGDAGNVEYAIEKYKIAISLHPKYDQAMNNLGNIYKDRGNLTEAEELLTRATQCRSDFAAAWMNLGIVQASLGKGADSELSYRTALRHRKKYPDCYYNLGNLYLDQGRHTEAIQAWKNATFLKPTHVSAWSNIVILLDNLGRISEIEQVAREATRHLPNEPSLHYNLANAFGKAERYPDSESYFKSAIRLDPANAQYYANLGVLYHRWGKNKEAEKAYERALQMEPGAAQTAKNLQMLREKMAKLSGN